jgi:metal-responsive CopG/Arc/MetJ family transcriptional regulator
MPSQETGFRGISMKNELVADIQKFIEEHSELGYKSVSDFVQEATRIKIQNLKRNFPSKP